VSAADAKTLGVGNASHRRRRACREISQVSPAIDPQTGTVEVDIALSDSQSGLTDGDSVTVSLDRTASSIGAATDQGAAQNSASSTAPSIIPIVALKITPTGPEVFTIDPSKSVLVPHPVSIGSILGQDIVVTQGLTPDLMIVTDARGLVAGQSVTVKKS